MDQKLMKEFTEYNENPNNVKEVSDELLAFVEENEKMCDEMMQKGYEKYKDTKDPYMLGLIASTKEVEIQAKKRLEEMRKKNINYMKNKKN
jgi:hypothetical protein